MWIQRKQNKYHAKSSEYDGRWYHSKKEAAYAQELDLRKKAGDIKEWIPQYKIDLKVYGKHIANYYVDFKVINNDDSVELHEVKGFVTDLWRLKWKLLEAIYDRYHPGITLVVIR